MKTGHFEMSMIEYRAAHGVSQSTLKLLSRSPAHLKYQVEHPEPATPDQEIGQVFDIAVFQNHALKTCCHVRPSHYESEGKKKLWHNGANFCKDWTEKAKKDGRPIISETDMLAIEMMRSAVRAHPSAALALQDGKSGIALFAEDADTGLQLKGFPDWMSGNVIVDLKSCVDASKEGFRKAIARFGYDVQSAYYLDLCQRLGLPHEHFFFICCEKEPPYCVSVHKLDADGVADGRSKYQRYLRQYMQCVSTGKWPGYSPHVEVISLPSYAKYAEREAILLEDSPAQPALMVE